MLHAIRQRREDEGFTLIELMVVVLIISILIAIAIPTFLGARQGAQDRGAQSALRNGLTAAKTIFADEGVYNATANPADQTNLANVEPSLAYVAAAAVSTDQNTLSVQAGTDFWAAAALSDSGTCFYIYESASFGTVYGETTGGTCDAQDANMPGAAQPANRADADWTATGW